MRCRLLIASSSLILLTAVTSILWHALDWPPPRLLLKYGLPPAGGPTGRSRVIEGMEFVEVGPGYEYVDRHSQCLGGGDTLWRICSPLGLPFGRPPRCLDSCRRWAEVRAPYWISRDLVSSEMETKAHHARGKTRLFPNPSRRGANRRVRLFVKAWWPEAPYPKYLLAWFSPGFVERFRLPTLDELDLAHLRGAIRSRAEAWECYEILGEPRPGSVRAPQETGWGDNDLCVVFYRLVWIPPEDPE